MTTTYTTGCQPSPPDERDYAALAPSRDELDALPAFFQAGYQDPIYSQGGEGSCVGQATAGALGHFERITPNRGTPYGRRRSARDAYEGAREIEPVTGEGAYIRAALEWARKQGICTEADWPYVERSAGAPRPGAAASRATCKVARYERLLDDERAVKLALFRGQMVVVRIETCDGFNDARPDGTVSRSGRRGGGHAVVLVGWDDTRKAFRLRNSWGAGWGDRGYCWLPYDYGLTEAWSLTATLLPDSPPTPPAAAPWWLQAVRFAYTWIFRAA